MRTPSFEFSRGICGAWLLVAVLFWLPVPGRSAPTSGALVPASLGPHTDKLGNEWYVEQNGSIGNHRSGNAILGNSMVLQVGSEQFYAGQPMATPDGREIVISGQQPTQGLQVTRHVRFLDKEGGLLFLDVFMNPAPTDMNATIEYRQSFNGTVKSTITDSGRPLRGQLEKDESGFLIAPGAAGNNAYAFIVCTPRSSAKPAIAGQNQYQLSTRYAVTVPAGKSIAIMQAVMQGRISLRPDAKELEKMLRPFSLAHHLTEWPKNLTSLAINLRGTSPDQVDLTSWFPEEFFGVKREAMDVLAMGEGTRLRGHASCARLTLEHRLGKINVPWDQVVALCGARHAGSGVGRIVLADGQILAGPWQAEELRFEMNGGLRMDLKNAELDVLVRGAPGGPTAWPREVAALVENWNGERFAIKDAASSEITLVSAWGSRKSRLADLITLSPSADEGGGTSARFTDGSRLRVWPGSGEVNLQTALFGQQHWPVGSLRAVACALKPSAEDAGAEEDPSRPFVELGGEQRLMTVPSDPSLHLVTAGGMVALEPAAMKELRNVSEDSSLNPEAAQDDAPMFQVQLWGGGTVLGRLRDSGLRFSVGAAEWFVPAREVVRVVTTAPKITDATLARLGSLIRDLGRDEWKIREKASGELRSLGEIARPSLQEALKQAEDAEVKRRIEQLLGDLD